MQRKIDIEYDQSELNKMAKIELSIAFKFCKKLSKIIQTKYELPLQISLDNENISPEEIHLIVIRELIMEKKLNPAAAGNLPVLFAMEHGHINVVKFLITQL